MLWSKRRLWNRNKTPEGEDEVEEGGGVVEEAEAIGVVEGEVDVEAEVGVKENGEEADLLVVGVVHLNKLVRVLA